MNIEEAIEKIQEILDIECRGMGDIDYTALLHEIIDECRSRLSAMNEED